MIQFGTIGDTLSWIRYFNWTVIATVLVFQQSIAAAVAKAAIRAFARLFIGDKTNHLLVSKGKRNVHNIRWVDCSQPLTH